jgi:hypothetical protein
MSGQQDIVLAPVSPLPVSTSPNPADIICRAWDLTSGNITLYPINGNQTPGQVTITMIALPPWVAPTPITLAMYPITPPVFSLLPNPADMVMIPFSLSTPPSITMIPLSQNIQAAPMVTIVLGSLSPVFPSSQSTVYYGRLKRWTGGRWSKKPLKYWNGSTWVVTKLKRWTGTLWGLIDTTGV